MTSIFSTYSTGEKPSMHNVVRLPDLVADPCVRPDESQKVVLSPLWPPISKRDSTVFEQCCHDKIPIAWNLAGGYQKAADGSIHKVIEIHRETMRQCNRVFDQAS